MEKEKNKGFIDLAKRRGFFWQSSEIYGGMSGIFDYGPLGLLLKRKLINKWRKFFIEDNIYEVETSIIQPEKVFEAELFQAWKGWNEMEKAARQAEQDAQIQERQGCDAEYRIQG